MSRYNYPTVGNEPFDPNDPAVREALASLNRKVCQFCAKAVQLQQLLARARAGVGERLKRRVPQVHKSLSTPAETTTLLLGAQAALKAGPSAYASWAAGERQRQASVA